MEREQMIRELEWLALQARRAGDTVAFRRYLKRADQLRYADAA